ARPTAPRKRLPRPSRLRARNRRKCSKLRSSGGLFLKSRAAARDPYSLLRTPGSRAGCHSAYEKGKKPDMVPQTTVADHMDPSVRSGFQKKRRLRADG